MNLIGQIALKRECARGENMRVTIKDITKATGLSVTTVSLVLNDKPHKIADKTKELIKKTAEEMHYVPNQMARGLAQSKSKVNHKNVNIPIFIDKKVQISIK